MRVHTSLACFPHRSFDDGAARAARGTEEPWLGRCPAEIIQLVPQAYGVLCEEVCARLRSSHPGKGFRLHANVQLHATRVMADLSGVHRFPTYFERLKEINDALGAPMYTAHAGKRAEASMQQMLCNLQALSQHLECVVAVEGHYPTPKDTFLVSDWREYRVLLESGVPFVVDLSHLNIVATQTGVFDRGLLAELLASERCVEVHISDNDGTADQHLPLQKEPWWWKTFVERTRPEATVFTEGRART